MYLDLDHCENHIDVGLFQLAILIELNFVYFASENLAETASSRKSIHLLSRLLAFIPIHVFLQNSI